MAKKSEVKKITVKVKRGFMAAGKVVPAIIKSGKDGKDLTDCIVELPVSFARELIANGKAVETSERKNFDLPKEEKTLEDELADL
jgi:hypothetical protein